MSESGERETETTTEATPPDEKGDTEASAEGAPSEPAPSSIEPEPTSFDATPISVKFDPDSSASRPTPTNSGTVPTSDPPVDSDRSWDDVTPPRRVEGLDEGGLQWSASEVTVVRPPTAPEADPGPLPSFLLPEVHNETSGTVEVPNDRVFAHLTPPRAIRTTFSSTRAAIELGRPLFAVAAIGIIAAVVAFPLAGTRGAVGVAIGASAATLNLWTFTRIGTAFFSRRGVRASWGLVAGLKLLVLFGGVATVLKLELADPFAFLVGYLALPVGIVASQLLGLQPDFEEP